MIFVSQYGLTVNEWFTEIRRRRASMSRARKGKDQKRAEVRYAAKKPLFQSARAAFKRIMSRRER